MEIIYFLLFVAICFGVFIWFSRKSGGEKDLGRHASGLHKSASEKLHTPADNVLGHREEIWRNRCHSSAAKVVKTNKFIPKSETLKEPEYDGYSRRDRHHTAPDPVHAKTRAMPNA